MPEGNLPSDTYFQWQPRRWVKLTTDEQRSAFIDEYHCNWYWYNIKPSDNRNVLQAPTEVHLLDIDSAGLHRTEYPYIRDDTPEGYWVFWVHPDPYIDDHFGGGVIPYQIEYGSKDDYNFAFIADRVKIDEGYYLYRLWAFRQPKNTSPTLTQTQPSVNSPLEKLRDKKYIF